MWPGVHDLRHILFYYALKILKNSTYLGFIALFFNVLMELCTLTTFFGKAFRNRAKIPQTRQTRAPLSGDISVNTTIDEDTTGEHDHETQGTLHQIRHQRRPRK